MYLTDQGSKKINNWKQPPIHPFISIYGIYR